jgi:hypothetical protein
MNPTPSAPITQAFKEPLDAHNVVESLSSNASTQFEQMAQIEAMLGGKAPYDDAELRNTGHAEMLNVNFRSGRLRVRRTFRRYLDLLVSPPRAVSVAFKEWDEPSTREMAQNELAEFLTHALRCSTIMRARRHRVRDMIHVGAGFAYFPSPSKPTPRFLPRGGVLLPLDAKDSPKEWSVCAIHDQLTPAEILGLIDRIRAGAADGWNLRGLQLAAWRAFNEDRMTDDRAFDQEKALATEQKIRFNAVGVTYVGTTPVTIPISRVYTRNASGKVDMDIIERRAGVSEWLCRKKDVAECFSELLYPLYYQEDEHLYWNIEGLGNDIFNAEMLKDQNMNATADAASLIMRPIVSGGTAGKSVSPPTVDRFIHVGQGEEVSFDAMRGDTLNSPVLLNNILEQNLAATANGTAPGSNVSSVQPVSAAEAKVEQIEFTEQHTVAADFMYEQEGELVEEICKRLLNYEKAEIDPDEEGEEFLKKIKASEFHVAKHYKPKNVKITLYRAVGAGSGRDRRNALGVIYQNRGGLNPIGQKRITHDFVHELAGPDAARRYAEIPDEKQTPTTHGQHAHIENAVFKGGTQLPTPVDDNHGIHAPIHLTALIAAVQEGMQAEEQQARFDSQGMLAFFNAALPHTARHIDLFVAGANTAELKKQGDEFVSALSQITNYYQRIQKRVKDEQIAQAKAAEQQQIAAMQERAGIQQKMQAMEAEIVRLRTDTSIKQQTAANDQRIKREESQANIALREREAERTANLPR